MELLLVGKWNTIRQWKYVVVVVVSDVAFVFVFVLVLFLFLFLFLFQSVDVYGSWVEFVSKRRR